MNKLAWYILCKNPKGSAISISFKSSLYKYNEATFTFPYKVYPSERICEMSYRLRITNAKASLIKVTLLPVDFPQIQRKQ